MKTVENLEGRDLMIVEARKINGGKIQLTFAQKVANPTIRPTSIAGLLNKSDERFEQSSGVRYAWMAGTPQDIKELLGIETSDLVNVNDKKQLDILNPEIDGIKLNIQLTETTQGSEYQEANFETAAKRAGKDGDFILSSKGEYIFTNATVVAGEPKHVFITNTVRSKDFVASGDSFDSEIENELNS